MRQVFLQKGQVHLKTVDVPACGDSSILVQVHYSFVSSGTEGATLANSGQSLLERFTSNVSTNTQKVLGAVKEHGVGVTLALIKEKAHQVMPLGYSCSGQVVALGKNVQRFRIGDYVACAGAGIANHAELVAVPQNLAVKITDASFLKQSSLTTIGAIALQGVRRASLQLGEKVCVIGLGLIGQLTVQLAKLAGCQVIGVDLQEHRLTLAKKMGATHAFSATSAQLINEIQFATEHYGVDATIITAASPTGDILQQAMHVTRRKGRVVLVGDVKINFDRDPFYSKEIDFLISCSYGPGRYDDEYEKHGRDYPYAYVRWTENRNMELFVNLIQSKALDVDALISHEYGLEDVELAYQTLTKGQALGLVLSYNPEENHCCSGVEAVFNQSTLVLDRHKLVPYEVRQGALKLAVIGAGGFSKVKLLPLLAKIPSVKIHAIVDLDVANSMNVAHQYGALRVSNDYQKFLGDDDINAVVIATPHHLHVEQAINFMRAGKAVFVEKPAAVNFEQFAVLKQFLHKHAHEVCYCVDFNRSQAPFLVAIKELVKKRNNPMVIHYRMNAGFLPKTHWIHSPVNSGRIIGEGCHIFDLFCYLTDAKPVAVSVETLNTHKDIFMPSDNFMATVSMNDGSCCSFVYTAVGNSGMGKERMELFVDGKSIVMDDFLELTGYGLPMAFNRKVAIQDRGHQRLLTEFFAAAHTREHVAPISYERILMATELSLVVNKLANAGGGTESM